jgi:hypothetical protein
MAGYLHAGPLLDLFAKDGEKAKQAGYVLIDFNVNG